MNFLARWWNRRKLKVELPKPIIRVCDNHLCHCGASWYCETHALFLCNLDRDLHGNKFSGCTFYSLRAAIDFMTGRHKSDA